MLDIEIRLKTFPATADAPACTVFRDFALSVPGGQVCAITGPSGIGKTTLLSIVAGLDRTFVGTVRGRVPPVGFSFQSPRLLPWATALRNIELAIPRQKADARGWLEAVGLAGQEDVYPERLSLGMARRVALARALAVEPALLILDEPFSGLDDLTARRMRDLLVKQLAAAAATTLIVTHSLDEAASLADRIVVLAGLPAQIERDVAIRIAPEQRTDGRAIAAWRRAFAAETAGGSE